MITYQLEGWPTFYADAKELWAEAQSEHGQALKQEKGQETIDPDVEIYAMLDRIGKIMILTVRDGKKLIGYTSTVMQKHLHFKNTLIGFEDTHYLAKEYRKGSTGIRMFRETERQLRELGVKRYFLQVYEKGRMDVIFKRLGFAPVHAVYSKWIGD